MFRAHVLIIRRSKLHYTASGNITPVGGRLVHVKNHIVILDYKKRTPRVLYSANYSVQKSLCSFAVTESNEKSMSIASKKFFDWSHARLDRLSDSSANDSFFTWRPVMDCMESVLYMQVINLGSFRKKDYYKWYCYRDTAFKDEVLPALPAET